MKTLKFTIILVLVPLLFSCQKEGDSNDDSTIEKTVTYSISSDDTLEHNLGTFGDEEGLSIETQASHYEISEVDRFSTPEAVYRYKAEPGFSGEDYVEIRSARGSNGASENTDIIITQLQIVVE